MRSWVLGILLLLSFLVKGSCSFAQDSTRSVAVFPIAFYLPETRWGFGGAGILSFDPFPADTLSPPSQIRVGGAYTQERQVLSYLSYDLFWDQRNWNASGEFGWYKYSYFFFGVGNDVSEDFRETYHLQFPRIRANLIRKLDEHWFGGLQLLYDNYSIDDSRFDPDGILIAQQIPGWMGGSSVGIGPKLQYDTRDHVYNSSRGIWLELSYQHFGSMSAYQFDKYRAELRAFHQPFPSSVIGFNAVGLISTGDVPFTSMAMLGGNRRMRGYYEGRYRDRNQIQGQIEWRQHVWKRIGAVGFIGAGVVSHDVPDFQIANTRFAGGAGLRYMFDQRRKINIRLDYAVGKNSSGWYLTFGEAF